MYPMILLCHNAEGEQVDACFKFNELSGDSDVFLLSARDEGESTVKNGDFEGLGINEVICRLKSQTTSENLPVYIKFINAVSRRPVTVYPDDEYASLHSQGAGKTSLLYITDATDGAEMVYGLSRTVSPEELRRRVAGGSLSAVCNFVSVQKGDVFFIPPGVVFAIGGGIVAIEISTNNDNEYIVSDYGRAYKDGAASRLNINRALDVMSTKKTAIAYGNIGDITLFPFGTVRDLCETESFSVQAVSVNGNVGFYEETQTVSMIVVSGEADASYSTGTMRLKEGDSVLVPEGVKIRLSGKTEILYTKFK